MRNRITLALVMLLVASCSGSAESAAHHNYSLIGSTACDAGIKTALGIPVETKCDFIRWNLTLDPSRQNAFTLDVNYGESLPNTLGFIAGGQRITAAGKFETATLADKREIFKLRSAKPAIDLSLVKINSNFFHLIMPDGTMMLGNGGWSYSLYRNTPLAAAALAKASFASGSAPKLAKTVFDGRTPCADFPRLFKVDREPGCLKIKWRVTLDRDPATLAPATFKITGVIPDRVNSIDGRWSESKLPSGAIVYKLQPSTGAPISLLLAEDNLLFFLDTNGQPLVGNKDFSFTLNKRADLSTVSSSL